MSKNSRETIRKDDLQLVNDLNAALQKEKHHGQFWVIMLLFAFLVVFVIWAYNSPLEEVTRGQGSIIPSSREQVIQSLDPGTIAEMRVQEGDIVEKDEVLLKLDDTRSSAILRESEAKVANLEAMLARLKAESYGTAIVFPAGISKDLQNEGVRLEIIEFTDYVTPNAALESGQIDANFFQHIPYLQSFNEEQGTHLVSAGGVHIEPLALYSKKYSALEQLSDGAVIAIPNDPTNEGRSLLLLQSAQLIRLKENAGIAATPADIAENPKKLKFREIEAASLPRVLADTDAAVINGNYAIPAGLSAAQNGLFVEGSDSPYVNVVAVKKGNENDERIAALMQALRSEKIAAFIAERYPNGEVVKVF